MPTDKDRILNAFYDNLILPGTKIPFYTFINCNKFYDNLILPGTKINTS